MKKIIAFDLDGTTIDAEENFPYELKDLLKSLKERGHVIVAATGRVHDSAVKILQNTSFLDYIISTNGAAIYSVEKENFILKKAIHSSDLCEIIKFCKDVPIKYRICDLHFYYQNKKYDSLYSDLFVKPIYDFFLFLTQIKDVLKIEIFYNNFNDLNKQYLKLERKFPHMKIFKMQSSFSDHCWLEIGDKGVDKWNAIQQIMKIEHIEKRDVIAFGDGRNDIVMLKESGMGVAVFNALSDVKKVADDITESNKNLGVKLWLQKYFE